MADLDQAVAPEKTEAPPPEAPPPVNRGMAASPIVPSAPTDAAPAQSGVQYLPRPSQTTAFAGPQTQTVAPLGAPDQVPMRPGAAAGPRPVPNGAQPGSAQPSEPVPEGQPKFVAQPAFNPKTQSFAPQYQAPLPDEDQIKNEQDVHSTGIDMLNKAVYESATKLRGMVGAQRNLQTLQAQADELGDTAKKTEGGIFGIGAKPTSEALAAQHNLQVLQPQIDQLTGQVGDVDAQKASHKELTSDLATWRKAKPQNAGDLDAAIGTRIGALVQAGKNPDSDPILAAMDARKKELGMPVTQRPGAATAPQLPAQTPEQKAMEQGSFDSLAHASQIPEVAKHEPNATGVWNPRNEEIKSAGFKERTYQAAAQVGRIVDSLFQGGTLPQNQLHLISPEVADVAARYLGTPARIITNLMGRKRQAAEAGTEQAISGAISGFTLESLGSLPAFVIPGVAETYAAGIIAKLPVQYGQIKDSIARNGLFSKETAKAFTENGITDVLGFLGIKGGHVAGKGVAEGIAGTMKPETADLVRQAVVRAKKNGVTPEFRAFFGGIDPEVAGTTPEKVQKFAEGLGMKWSPQPKPEAAPTGEAPPTEQATSPTKAPKAPSKPDNAAISQEIDNLQLAEGARPEDHAETQTTLRGLAKIGQGQPMEALTSAEEKAVTAKGADGLPKVEIVNGEPVVTDAALARVRQVAPVTASLFPQSETDRRAAILASPEKSPTAKAEPKQVQQQSVQPSQQETLPTFAVEVQNAKGETETREIQAVDEGAAKKEVAKTIPTGKGLVREVTQIAAAPAPKVAPENFIEAVTKSAAENKGSALTPIEKKQSETVGRVLQPHYARWSKAFDSVNALLASAKTGGVAFGKNRELQISVRDVIAHGQLFHDTKEHGANLMLHEAAHAVTTSAAPQEVLKLWKQAPRSLRDAMKKAYKASGSDYSLAHEYWAYFLAGRAELAAGRRIRLAGKFLPEQASREFIVENRRAIAKVLRFVRNSEKELRKEGASPDFIRQWRELENLFQAKMKEVDAHSKEAVNVSQREGEKPGSVPAEPTARGPPHGAGPGQAESAGVQRAGERAGTIGATGRPDTRVAAPPKAAGISAPAGARTQLGETAPTSEAKGLSGSADERRLSPEDRASLATALKVPEGAVGNLSTVSQAGRTLNVAYVAQEAADARPSHDIQGRANPLFDQSLQPRDRSLASYRKQAQNIANTLDFKDAAFFPGTTTPATTTDVGPPIMLKHGDTLIGNGREIGIKAAYDQGLTSAQKYKTDFIRNARTFGINPATVRDMQQPILKRVIVDDLPKEELIRFSQESNAPTAMASNALEVAAQDASRLSPQILSLFNPNYDLEAAKNQGFLKAYVRDVVRGTTANEANMTPSEIARRVRAAVFTYAYGAGDAGRAALERLAGDETDGGKTITSGLLTVAPIMARLRVDVAGGDLQPGFDVTPAISRAAQEISKALLDRPKNQSAKVALDSLLSQGELFAGDPLERSALEFLVDNRTKRTGIEEGLSNYAESVYRLGNPKEGELFAGREIPTPLDLFNRSTSPEGIERKEAHHALASQRLNESLKSQEIIPATREIEELRSRERRVADSAELNLSPEFKQAVEDDAVNGYPGLQGFHPNKGLTRNERVIEAHFAQMIAQDKEGMLQKYEQLAEKEFGAGYVNADLARDLYPAYRDDAKNRLFLDRATLAPAGYVSLGMEFSKIIRAPRDPQKPYAMFLSAGMANGKSTVVNHYLAKAKSRSALTYDSTMQNFARAKEAIDASLASGLQPMVVYVYRPFGQAIDSVINRMIKIGRPVAMDKFGQVHAASQKVFFDLVSHYGDQVDFKIVANDGKLEDIREIPIAALRKLAYENTGENTESISRKYGEEIERNLTAGRIDAAQARALRSGSATDELRGGGRSEQTGIQIPTRRETATGPLAVLRSQQFDLFNDYAASLPAKAKVSKPVLKETVDKEVPQLSEHEQALDDLMKLVNHETIGGVGENRATAGEAGTSRIKAGGPSDTGGEGVAGELRPDRREAVSKRDAARRVGEILEKQTRAFGWQESNEPAVGDAIWMSSDTGQVFYNRDELSERHWLVSNAAGIEAGDAHIAAAFDEERKHQQDRSATISTGRKFGSIQSRVWHDAPKNVKTQLQIVYGGRDSPTAQGAEIIRMLAQVADDKPITETTAPWVSDEAKKMEQMLRSWTAPNWLTEHVKNLLSSVPGTGLEPKEPNTPESLSVSKGETSNAISQQKPTDSLSDRGTQPQETAPAQPGVTQNEEVPTPRLRGDTEEATPAVREGLGSQQLAAHPAEGLTFIRHGTTELNGESGSSPDKIRGHVDVPLDANGRRQAVKAGRQLANSGITKIYASDLSRGTDTAKIAASQIKTRPQVVPTYGLRPWSLGNEIEGKESKKVMPEVHRLVDNPDEPAKGGGESLNDFKNRFLSTIAQIKADNPGGNVAIATHFRGLKLLKSIDENGNLDVQAFKEHDKTIPPGTAVKGEDLAAQPLANQFPQLPERMGDALTRYLNGEDLGAIGPAAARLVAEGARRINQPLLSQALREDLKAQATAETDPHQALVDLLNSDLYDKIYDKAKSEVAGQRTVGRPDLALGGLNAEMAAVHEFHTDITTPETFEKWDKEADQILSDHGVAGMGQYVVQRWLNGETLRPGEVRAAQKAILRDSQAFGPAGQYAYTRIGRAVSQMLAARRDPTMTPEQRSEVFLRETLNGLTKAQDAQIDAITDAAEKSRAIEKVINQRRDQINRALETISGKGVTIDDILSGGVELRLKGAKIIENQMKDHSESEKKALRLAQSGERTAKEIANLTGLSVKRVEDLNDERNSDIERQLMEKALRGATFENLDPALLSQELGSQPTVSEEVAKAEVRKMMRAMGLVASKDLGKFKVVKRKPKSRLFVPPAPSGPPVEPPTGEELPYPPVGTATGRVLGQPGLPLYQERMVHKGGDLGNVDDVAALSKVMQATNGNRFDMLFEAGLANLLSNPTTHIAYKMAVAAGTAWQATVQNGAEALVNLLVRAPNSASFGEMKHLMKGVLPGIMRGWNLGVRQFRTESELFDADVMAGNVEMFEGAPGERFSSHGPAISEAPLQQFFGPAARPVEKQLQRLGPLNPVRGRAIRVPMRALYFIDGFYKGLNAQMWVAPFAYRMAKSEGLKGEDFENRIRELTATPGSEAWHRAKVVAEWVAARSRILNREQQIKAEPSMMRRFTKAQVPFEGVFDNAVARIANARANSYLIGSQIPFVQLPYNLVKMAGGKLVSPVFTPVKAAAAAAGALPFRYDPEEGFYKINDGKTFFNRFWENYPKGNFVKDVATAGITTFVMYMLWNAVAGDGNDDEKKLLFTGSTPSFTRKGQRQLQQRAYGGPFVFRIGGRSGISINYGKYEPAATVLGAIADTIMQLKRVSRGQETIGDGLNSLWDHLASQIEEKSFIRNIGNLMKVFEGEMSWTEMLKRQAISWLVPGLVRAPIRNLDDSVRDTRHASFTQLITGAGLPAKIDLYGRPEMKTGNAFSRMFFISTQKPAAQLEKADQVLLRWNNTHPQLAKAPEDPKTYYTDKTGKQAQMTPDQQTKFLTRAGERFRQELSGKISQHMIDHPTEKDVSEIIKLHAKAVKETRDTMFPKPIKTTNVVREWLGAAA